MVPAGAVRGQEPASSGRSAGPVLGCQRGPTSVKRLQHFKRHGVDHICGYPGNGADPASWSVESLTALRDLCASHGVSLDMVQFPTLSSASIDTLSPQHETNPQARRRTGKAIMLGKDPERQQEIEFVRDHPQLRARRHPGRQVQHEPARRAADAPTRRAAAARATAPGGCARRRKSRRSRRPAWSLPTRPGSASPTSSSASCRWPTEHKVRLACHPHDPGVPPRGFRGVVRVLGTVDGMKRFVDIAAEPLPRPEPVPRARPPRCCSRPEPRDPRRHPLLRRAEKIFNIHFRNIRGRRDDFQETFPDEGDMDMVAVMRTLKQVGYQYMVMPDHMPQHADDPRRGSGVRVRVRVHQGAAAIGLSARSDGAYPSSRVRAQISASVRARIHPSS